MDSATIKRYAKFVVAAAGAVAIAGNAVVNGDLDTTQGLVNVGFAVLAAFGVKQIPNA